MDSQLVRIILAEAPSLRDTPLEKVCDPMSPAELASECEALDQFRRDCSNLYQRVRALMFLYAIYRFYLPRTLADGEGHAAISYEAYKHLLERRFAEAIDGLLAAAREKGLSDAICSALAKGYHQLAMQNLADQVRSSVRAVRGNQWMFRTGSVLDQPLRVR